MDASPEEVGQGVWRVTSGVFPSNAYVCGACGNDGFVVDPGLDPLAIDAACRKLGIRPRQVFCTHGHFDHIGGARHFQDIYATPVFLHPADQKTMRSGNFLLMAMRMDVRITLPRTTALEDGADYPAACGAPIRALHTPGHTPGGCLLAWGEALFTGDTLYAQGVGLSDLPGEDHARLRESLHAVWDTLDDEAIIHPGHGPSARLGEVKRDNRALRAFLALEGAAA